MKKISDESIAWLGLREIYRLLGTKESNTIVRLLLKNELGMRTSELIEISGISPAKFHVTMKALVLGQVVDRKVHDNRSVSYTISPFGKNLLDLSEPLLDKITEKFKDKDSLLLNSIQQKEKNKPIVNMVNTT